MADLPLGSTPADALVDWVCARAAANRSVSHCDHCSHWEQPPLVRADALPPPPRRARTAWFLCLTQPRDAISREHQQFARAAIVSARLNAPSVAPHAGPSPPAVRARGSGRVTRPKQELPGELLGRTRKTCTPESASDRCR